MACKEARPGSSEPGHGITNEIFFVFGMLLMLPGNDQQDNTADQDQAVGSIAGNVTGGRNLFKRIRKRNSVGGSSPPSGSCSRREAVRPH